MPQFDREDLVIPSSLFCKAIVCEYIGPLVSLTQMREPHAGHGLQVELLGRLQPTMTCNDVIVVVDQYRVVEPKTLDAAGDLLDLLRRMGASIG